jgi:Kef-type K+ transport system membrane component KefB
MKLPDCYPGFPKEELARWRRRFFAITVATAAAILLAAWVGKQFPLRSPMRIAMALVQGAASTALIVAIARPIRQLDELQRRIQLEALAFAFAGTAILATAYGFLINAGLPEIDWGAWVWPGMTVLWAIGQVIAGRRYR